VAESRRLRVKKQHLWNLDFLPVKCALRTIGVKSKRRCDTFKHPYDPKYMHISNKLSRAVERDEGEDMFFL
jgi:hypothetical protein